MSFACPARIKGSEFMTVRIKCREFVEKHCAGYDASHDISHIDRVVSNAIKIYNLSDDVTKAQVDTNVLIAIASLHDSFDHKYLTTCEAVTAAKAEVTAFLSAQFGFSPETISTVITVIDNMGYTAEVSGDSQAWDGSTTAYLHIVQDADRLDAIGAMGARCLAFTGAFKRPIISPDGQMELEQRRAFAAGELKPVASKGGSAIGHFYDKLLFLQDMLKTPAGKKIGLQRHEFLLQFLDQFFEEAGLL